MTRAVLVPPAKIGTAWPYVAHWVLEALTRGNAPQSSVDVRQHLDRATMQLWMVWDGKPVGCCVTELIDSPRGRTCNLVAVAGDRWHSWAHLLEDVEQWALQWNGCVRLSMTGRKGWARRLAGDGWHETAVTLEKAIGDGQQHAED